METMSGSQKTINEVIREAFLNGNILNENYKKRIPIQLDMNLEVTIAIMAEQTPGAREVLYQIAAINPLVILDFDDMNMRGQQIWSAYMGFSKENMDHFMVHAQGRTQDLVNFVNAKFPHIKAVRAGGAPK